MKIAGPGLGRQRDASLQRTPVSTHTAQAAVHCTAATAPVGGTGREVAERTDPRGKRGGRKVRQRAGS